MNAAERFPGRWTARQQTSPLVSLVDRLRWVAALRLLVTASPLLMWWCLPADRTSDLAALLAPAALCALVVLLSTASARLPRRLALWVLGVSLLVDGTYLAWAFRCLAGFDGAVGYVFVLHAVGLTLTASFRTGLKLALWHSLALLVVVEADAVGVFGAPVLRAATTDYLLLLSVLWGLTLMTAVLAAVNERELRRRRYDSDVLRRFALDLESADGTTAVAVHLSQLAQRDLLATRALVQVMDPAAPGHPAVVVSGDAGGGRTAGPSRAGLPAESLPARALATRRTLLALQPDARHDEWLAAALPGARNLVVVPLLPGGEITGVLVVEHLGGRRRAFPLPGTSRNRVERRSVAALEQAAAHAGQALARTALMARLTAAANTDALTGVLNRRALDATLVEEVTGAGETGTDCSVVLLDLDHFKALNDTHGHPAGDQALRAVGAVLRTSLRGECTAARYGGEEFCVVLPRTGHEEALLVAERLRRAIASAEDAPVAITASLGVASFPRDGTDAGALVAAADAALYAAKTAGRDRVSGPPSSSTHRAATASLE